VPPNIETSGEGEERCWCCGEGEIDVEKVDGNGEGCIMDGRREARAKKSSGDDEGVWWWEAGRRKMLVLLTREGGGT
jgi:hypothetical protein